MTSDFVSAFQGKEELACKNKKSIENAQLAKKKCCLDEGKVCSGEMFSNSIKLDGLERKNVSRNFFLVTIEKYFTLTSACKQDFLASFPEKGGKGKSGKSPLVTG